MLKRILPLLVSLVATAAAAGTLEETFDHTYDVKAGARFTLDNTNGHVTIQAWDQPRIRVRAVKKAESFNTDAAKKGLQAVKVEVTPAPDGVKVVTRIGKEGDFHWLDFLLGEHVNTSVEYEVNVPRATNVHIENVNGNVELKDVNGELNLETTNGRITMADCSGRITAETTNGSITADLSAAPSGLSFETTNGRISVGVPRTIAARIDAENTNGSIRSDLPVTATSARRHTLQGTLNGGGPELRMRTTNGSIELRAR